MNGIVDFNVGGQRFSTTINTISVDKQCTLYIWYIELRGLAHLTCDKSGAYFIDRDPASFSIILNYLRLRASKQLWESCLPKDPDRLALLTQEAEYFKLPLLRDQAIALLHSCTIKSGDPYVDEVLSKSVSCPQGFDIKNLKLDD